MSSSYSVQYLSHNSTTITFQYKCPDDPGVNNEWWALYEGEVPEYKDLRKYAKWGWICPEKKGCTSSGIKTVNVENLGRDKNYSIALFKWEWNLVSSDDFILSKPVTLESLKAPPSFNNLQQIVSIGILSNLISSEMKWSKNQVSKEQEKTEQEAVFEEELKKKVKTILDDDKIQQMLGGWEIVWGPKVYQRYPEIDLGQIHPSVSDNAMYVARRTNPIDNQDEYIVAISGTNPYSVYGWFVEDGTLSPLVSWPYNSNTGDLKPKITQGTSIGLNILLNDMVDNNNHGKLVDFFEHVVTSSSNPVKICVAGHSLGGTLSVSLGLALADLQGDTWDKNYKSVVSVASSAGATAGNVDFAQYYDLRLGTRTNRIWNQIDMVPHAWQSDMVLNIPNLYYPHIVPNALIYVLSDAALWNSKSAGTLKHVNAQTPGLPGQVNLDLIYNIGLTQLELGFANFIIPLVGKYLKWPQIIIDIITIFVDDLIKQFNDPSKKQEKPNLEAMLEIDSEKHQEFTPLDFENLASEFKSLPFESKVLELATRTIEIDGYQVNILEQLKGVLVFFIQAGWQHTTAYAHLVGIYPFFQAYEKIVAKMD